MKGSIALRVLPCAAAVAVAFTFAGPASAGDVLKSPSECELHRQLSNTVPAECQAGVKYRSLVPVGSGVTPPPPAVAEQASTGGGRRAANLTISFEYNSANLTSGARGDLDRLASVLNHGVNSGTRFDIIGHTDASGGEVYNQKLSSQRAASVRSYLQARGVNAGRLHSEGKGKSELLDPTNPTAAANRRVEIVNLGQ